MVQAIKMMNIGSRKRVLFPSQNDPWEVFTMSLSKFSEDFMQDGRQQPSVQVRNNFL